MKVEEAIVENGLAWLFNRAEELAQVGQVKLANRISSAAKNLAVYQKALVNGTLQDYSGDIVVNTIAAILTDCRMQQHVDYSPVIDLAEAIGKVWIEAHRQRIGIIQAAVA